MATHFKGPLLGDRNALGGAGENLLVEATSGGNEMVTVFDDFNHVVPAETFGDVANWETSGWVLTDAGAGTANDVVSMNAAATATLPFDSCIRIVPGTAVDSGGNMQLDKVNSALPASGAHTFPHIWIPESAAGAAVLDNTILTFACRIGLVSNAATWDGKLFIGWAEAGDVAILDPLTGAITQPETGPLIGFRINELGAIDGICQRTVNTAYAQGTNFTTLYPAATPDGNLGLSVWFELAVRMRITDMSDNAANGTTTFYKRRVPRVTVPGALSKGDSVEAWERHPVVLRNQTPNNDVALVPTIEVMNGPANVSIVLVDWWAFGISRPLR